MDYLLVSNILTCIQQEIEQRRDYRKNERERHIGVIVSELILRRERRLEQAVVGKFKSDKAEKRKGNGKDKASFFSKIEDQYRTEDYGEKEQLLTSEIGRAHV